MVEYYLRIDGGYGRCIAATGAVVEFAKQHPDDSVNVVTSFPSAFEGLDGIDRVYPIGTPFLYEDKIIKGIYLEPEPYNDVSFYAENKHLAQVFNKLLNGKDEYVSPIINLTENEKLEAQTFLDNERKILGTKIVLVQPWASTGGRLVGQCGSGVCDSEQKVGVDETFRSFGTEFAKRLCERLIEEGYTPYIIKSSDQIGFKGCKTFNGLDQRKQIALIPFVDGVICCDSFLHHACAALGTPVPTVVLWAGTSELNFGYPEQVNIRSHKKTLYEPNRIPHDHSYYVNKNKGSNEFKLSLIDDILKVIKDGGRNRDNREQVNKE